MLAAEIKANYSKSKKGSKQKSKATAAGSDASNPVVSQNADEEKETANVETKQTEAKDTPGITNVNI